MFSENNKISGRQLGRMIFVETSGTIAFLSLNAISNYGSDGILIMLWIYLFALIYGMAMFKAARHMGKHDSKKIYRIIRAFLMIVLLAKFLCMAAIVLNAIVDVAKLILIPNVSSVFILAITLVSILYCINGGIEARGRACELFFYFVLVPIVFICISLIPKIEPSNIIPAFDMNLKSAFIDYLLLLWFFVPAEMLLLAKDCYDNTSRVRANVYAGITLSAVVNIFIYIGAVGVYGDATVSKMDKPVLRLMQISGIPGDFLNRQDGIMSIFLIVSMFCSAWALIYHINELIKNLFMQNKKLKSVLKVSAVAVILVVFIFFVYEGKHKEEIIAADVGGMDLEERQFVMSIIVSKAEGGLNFIYEIAGNSGSDNGSGNVGNSGGNTNNTGDGNNSADGFERIIANSLKEAEEKIRFKKGSYIDYTHMKVLIMDLEVMEDVEVMKNLINEMSNDMGFAENIVVCAMDMKEGLETDKDYGNTIEKITKNQELFKESEIFRFDKMYSLKEGSLTIPLIDTKINVLGSGIITKDAVFWQYSG